MDYPVFTIEKLETARKALFAKIDSGKPVQQLLVNDYPPVFFSNTPSDESENLPGGGCARNMLAAYSNVDGFYEPLLVAAFVVMAEKFSNIRMVDIGALWGHTSFVAGSIFKEFSSQMFEMNPLTSEVLIRNIELNRRPGKEYKNNNVLLANKTDEMDIVFKHYTARYGDGEGGQNLSSFKILRQNIKARLRSSLFGAKEASYIKKRMRVARLDDYLAEIDYCPDVIKIDVEGSQYDILLGSKATIERYHPIVLVEFDEPGASNYIGRSNRDVVEFLEGFGYSCIWGDHRFKNSSINFINSKTELPIECNSLGIFF